MRAIHYSRRRVNRKYRSVRIPTSRPVSLDLDGWLYIVEDDDGECDETPL